MPTATPEESRSRLLDFTDAAPLDAADRDLDPRIAALVETLLDRAADGDVTEAEVAINRLVAAPADEGLVIREAWLLRLRAILARARADEAAYSDYWDQYRAMATSLGFEGQYQVGRGDAMTPRAYAGSHPLVSAPTARSRQAVC